jgi:hypothetical protein
VSEVREIEIRKVGMKEVRVKAGTVRAVRADHVAERVDKVRADRVIEVRAIKAIKVERMFEFHHRQAQLKYLEALGMFEYQ